MREIKIILPIEKGQIVETVLTETGVEFSKVTDSESEIILIAATTDRVEEILSNLAKIGLGISFGRIHVSTLEVVIPSKEIDKKEARISIQELLSGIIQPSKITKNFVIFAVLSGILAALGLLADNAVIVIASMLISPLMGPMFGISLGTILFDKKLVKNGAIALIFGFLVPIIAGTLLTIIDPNFTLNPSITSRSTPTIAELGLAIISGVAFSLSFVSKEASALVGVAIAAALVPPAANIGIGIGALNLEIAAGSALLLCINIVAMLFFGMLTLWLQGIRPKESFRREKMAEKKVRTRFAVLIIALVVFSIPLAYSSWEVYTRDVIEKRANAVATSVVNSNYPAAYVVSIESDYYFSDPIIHAPSIRVNLIVATPNATYVANLGKEIADDVYFDTAITTLVSLQISILSVSS
ncbi:MAG: TIGR00341 family protein [Candidatus Odinarchaeia archaeon]